MLDFDLAELYEVQTGVLNQAVKRNIERFPEDFMFMLSPTEWLCLKSEVKEPSINLSQIVIGSQKHRETKKPPIAFTEQGIAMLSGILRSPKAVQVNIFIMRAFVKLREFLLSQDHLTRRVDDLERKMNDLEKSTGEQHRQIFEALRQLIRQENEPRKLIGFKR